MSGPEEVLVDDVRLARLERDEQGRPLLGGVALERALNDATERIYRGHHVDREVPVVVRTFPAHFSDARYRQMVDEARALAAIDSPHVLAVLGVGEEHGLRFAISELAPRGVTAAELVAGRDQPLPERYVRDIAVAATRAIVAAHDVGVIHRDVRPLNLLVPDGQPISTTRLTGFDHAYRVTAGESLPAATSGAVSPLEYTAPDQLDGRVDWTTDVYGIGATLYRLLSGCSAFPGATEYEITIRKVRDGPVPIDDVRGNLSPALVEVVTRAMGAAAKDRYPTARELLEALEGI